jgi:hypothetical protein
MQKLIHKITAYPKLAYLLAALAGLVYFFTALNLAHHTTSFLDEGLYTYKGWLFATGQYRPFADYSVWTNHMPLSFLIPGYVQKFFGPSLRTARYFMIFVGLLTQLGLWVVVRRWANRWWALGVVWVFALNPASIKLYTLSISQGLVACIFVWMLVVMLAEDLPLWRMLLGAVMASLLFSTRLNMAFVLPLVLLYFWWEYGFKKAFFAGLAGLGAFLFVQGLFYPDVLKMWGDWLPFSFLDAYRPQSNVPYTRVPESEEVRTPYRIALYLLLTLRLHFVALFSILSTWLLFPRVRKFTPRIRAAVFLSVLFVVLFGAHAMNTFSDDRCVSCLLLYVAYFDFLGLILLPLAFPLLTTAHGKLKRASLIGISALTILGLGFSAYEDISLDLAHRILPYVRDLYLWSAARYVLGLEELFFFRVAYLALAVSLGLVIFALFLLRSRRRQPAARTSLGYKALLFMLVVGLILSPTKILGRGNDFFACPESDVLVRFEEAGAELRSVIPAGSQVYWSGRLDAIFLYLPEVKIYAPQLNQVHNFVIGGDADERLKFGMWNDALAAQWLREADFVLSELGNTQAFEQAAFDSGDYLKVGSTGSIEQCREWRSVIEVYQLSE